MKRTLTLVICLAMILMLAACGGKEAPAPEEQPEVLPSGNNVVNPMHEATQDSILQEHGISFQIPAGAEEVKFWTIGSEPTILQMSFVFDGDEYTYRISTDSLEADISGMYFEWELEESTQIGGIEAKVNWNDWKEGVIRWFDAVPGIMYSLSQDTNATFNSLEIMANALYTPTQGEVSGDEDSFSVTFEGYLGDMQANFHPGTAGSSLTGASYAARFMDLLTEDAPETSFVGELTKHFKEGLSSEDAELFAMQMEALASNAENLLGQEDAQSFLADCGYEALYCPWDKAAMTAYFEAMQ